VKHGTIYGYNRCGCRCDLCRQARTDYQRKALADPRVKAAVYKQKSRDQRLGTLAKHWLAENQPEVFEQLRREVA
jgi:hypothetical protein